MDTASSLISFASKPGFRPVSSKFAFVGTDVIAFSLAMLVSMLFASMWYSTPLNSWANHFVGPDAVLRISSFIVVCTFTIGWFWGVWHHYSNLRPFWDEVKEIILVLTAALVVDAAFAFLAGQSFSRVWFVMLWTLCFINLIVFRFGIKSLLAKLGWLDSQCVFVGDPIEVAEAMEAIKSEPFMGFKPIGVVDAVGDQSFKISSNGQFAIPTFPLSESIVDFLCNTPDIKVIFVMPNDSSASKGRFLEILQRVALHRDDVFVVPAISGLPMQGVQAFNFFSHEVLFLKIRNQLNHRGFKFVKRVVDVVGSFLGILLLLPLFIYVSYRIKKESPGPVVFVQKRVGLDGKLFNLYKFRSMSMDADMQLKSWESEKPELWQEYVTNNYKLKNDPRITKIGNLIRKTSIDELPQLLNVFLGDMSIVGPRPLLPGELVHYDKALDLYKKVRPGITGLWQISGRSHTTFDTRISLDRWYVRNWSLWQDFVILIRTVKVVLRSDGAY